MALNLPRFSSPRFIAVHPETGRPVSFGKVSFYVAGTTTLRQIFSDREGLVPALNPHPLDAAGSCEVFMSGPYRVVVRDRDGGLVYDADRVNSVPRETPADNPGSLMAANNLADLLDPSEAREALGIARQADPTDATADRLLITGAFGLGGVIPEIEAVQNSANNLNRPTGWVSVSETVATLVGAPKNVRGVLHTMRGTSTLHQVYYPTDGGSPSPWYRLYEAGAWTPWIRNASSGVNGLHRWARLAGGVQHCWHSAAPFIYVSGTSLRFVWNFPVEFSGMPVITATFPSDSANFTGGMGITWPGMIRSELLSPSVANVYITRQYGTPDFTPGMDLRNVRLAAVGPWSP